MNRGCFIPWRKTVGRGALLLSIVVYLWYPQVAVAVEVAPRISDREIIESLSELKEGQKALRAEMAVRFAAIEQRFEERSKAVNERFDAMEKRFDERFKAVDQRFESIDQRFESMEKRFDERFEAVDQRFESIDRRFESIERMLGWILNLLSVLIIGIIGLVGFIIWDRKTVLSPLEKRLTTLEVQEEKLQYDLEPQHEEGSRLARLVQALRERAKTDQELATALRSHSLL
uniref:Uncharacterized protein n=1 Tax=Candidatus Kentrum sp. FW TaxID=2126338 RepID=A0A450RTI3_9GAMM|nr:MAG: hypothetical protein BECKFW1821A_GA0114235_1001116 [Candidatus Kentron sp. FW]